MRPLPQFKTLAWSVPLVVWTAALASGLYEWREAQSWVPLLQLAVLGIAGLVSLIIDRAALRGVPSGLITIGLIAAIANGAREWRADVVPLLVLHHFIGAVCLAKLLQRKRAADYEQLLLLALLLITLGGVISPSLWFVLAVLTFVTFGIYALITLHLQRERASVHARRRQAGLILTPEDADECGAPPSFRRAALLASLGMTIVTVVVFLGFPRVRLDALSHLAVGAVRTTGYATQIRFDGSSIITESDRPVCRLVLTRDGRPFGSVRYVPYLRLSTQHLYFRLNSGAYIWSDGGEILERRLPVFPPPIETSLLRGIVPSVPLIEQRYIANALPKGQKLFHLYPTVSMSASQLTHFIHRGSDGTLRAEGAPRHTVDYTVVSLDAGAPGFAPPLALTARDRAARAVRSPARWLSADVLRAARQLADEAGGADDPKNHRRVADRIARFLGSGDLTYTLDRITPRPGIEPVYDLLFESRKGNCEYYATAMAVLCQVVGVPARIVSGYCGGVYHDIGGYYQIREKDAHAWVEVYLPERGWTTYDPTPPSTAGDGANRSPWARAAAAFDYVQYLWVSNVVAFDTEDQTTLREKFERWFSQRKGTDGPRLRSLWGAFVSWAYGPPDLTAVQRGLYWLALALIALWVYLMFRLLRVLRRRVGRAIARRRRLWHGGFYGRVLRALARAGHTKPTGQTPREFAGQLPRTDPRLDPIHRITDLYYRTRFGGRSLSAEDTTVIETFLNALD